MNAIYLCCIKDPWLEVAIKLKKNQNVKPIYWVGWENDNTENNVQNLFHECIFHNLKDAWKGNFPNGVLDGDIIYPKLDGEIIKKYSYEENIAMKMMDRLDRTGRDFSFNERQQFFRHLLRSWMVVVEKYNIELIISPVVPHRVFDYALYVVSLMKNIRFIAYKHTIFPGFLIPVHKIDEVPCFNNKNDVSYNFLIKDYIKKIKLEYKKAEPHYMKEQRRTNTFSFFSAIKRKARVAGFVNSLFSLFKDSNVYWKQRGIEIQRSKMLNYKKHIFLKKGRLYKQKLKSIYENKCEEPNYDDKYIFVALHYQPEETSCPSGGAYVDQKLMVETLLKRTPANVFIYVKEHTSQFHPMLEGEVGRCINFYSDMLKFDRVKLISTKVNSFELIDNSLAVSTLTGTVGVEAIIRHKPVLIFGTASYKNMPYGFMINSLSCLENALREINAGIYFDDDKIEEGLNNMLSNSVKAYHYGNYKKLSGITTQEAVNNLYEHIVTVILDYGKM